MGGRGTVRFGWKARGGNPVGELYADGVKNNPSMVWIDHASLGETRAGSQPRGVHQCVIGEQLEQHAAREIAGRATPKARAYGSETVTSMMRVCFVAPSRSIVLPVPSSRQRWSSPRG